MGLINWIFDIYQHSKIDEARAEAAAARREVAAYRGAGGESRLERPVGELALALKTMQRMLVEKGVCTQQEFYALLHQVDLEDGRADGQAPL